MTSTTQAVADLHDAAVRAKYLAEQEGDNRIFHIRQISAYTARLVEGMEIAGPAQPVFSSVRAANAIMGRRA